MTLILPEVIFIRIVVEQDYIPKNHSMFVNYPQGSYLLYATVVSLKFENISTSFS